jgi:hypothetical protein
MAYADVSAGSKPETNRIVSEPPRRVVEAPNICEFMQPYGIDDAELIERTTTEVENVDTLADVWWQIKQFSREKTAGSRDKTAGFSFRLQATGQR